jgi:transketolase
VIVDFNGLQAMGPTAGILSVFPLNEKFKAFGWDVVQVDGHDHAEIARAIRKEVSGPKAIIAKTTKGKGVSFMEDDNNWHYKNLTKEDYERAIHEI